MNMEFDNAQDDRDALEKHTVIGNATGTGPDDALPRDDRGLYDPERGTDILTGEAAEKFDPVSGELPWDGFKDGRIQNFLGLDWAGEKLAAAERAMLENMEANKAAQERLEKRFGAVQAALVQEINKWQTAIEVYAKDHRDDLLVGRSRSRALPSSNVTLRWRKVPKRYDVPDTFALLAWAKANGCERAIFPEPVIEPLPEVAWFRRSAFNAWAKAQKTLPPEVVVVPESEELTVDTEEEEES